MKILVIVFILEFILYYCAPLNKRWMALLVGNIVFSFLWDPAMVVVLAFVTGISFWLGRHIEVGNKRLLVLSLILVSLPLFFYKYFSFLLSVIPIASVQMWVRSYTEQIITPLGLSFYTLTAMGYMIDIHYGRVCAEKHFGKYAAFLTFFPTLISGPIMRAGKIIPQIDSKRSIIRC